VPGWFTSAVWFDYDDDGRLDLFLCSFVEFGTTKNVVCGDNKLGRRYYCIPRVFNPTASLLFHNNGDGTFTEVSKGTAIAKAMGKALGVVATDLNNDGRTDLFVANDTVQNFLFMNRGKNKWDEIGLASEVGFSANGQPRSGMGVDAADLDGDGWQDLFVANVDQEMFALYRNNKDESFHDTANVHGIGQATRLLSGWGLKFFDLDNDGNLDLFLANGHPDDMVDQYGGAVKYEEPLLVFRGDGTKLQDVSASAGPVFERSFPARGLAVGDFDNDGRLDVFIGNNGKAPLLLRNRAGRGPPLGRPVAPGRDLQPRRDRREAHLVRERRPRARGKTAGRQLPLVARPARGASASAPREARLARDPVAGAQHARRADRGP
jgi:hypothetical protein